METFFSVYKIDTEFVWVEVLGKTIETIDCKDICEYLLSTVKNKALSGSGIQEKSVKSENEEDYFLLYSKSNQPSWLNTVAGNFPSLEFDKQYFYNRNTSFIMLSIVGKNIFATTGGHASSYIRHFIIRNFGLNMLSKMFEGSDPVIQELTENHMVGGRQSTSAINRKYTNFENEKEFSKIFKKIAAKASFNIGKQLGILESNSTEDNYRRYNIISTDALNIRKMMTISEYKDLLGKIKNIWETESNFALSYFVSLNNFGISASQALGSLCNKIMESLDIIDDIQLVASHNIDFLEANKWMLYGGDKLIANKIDSPFTFKEIFEIFVRENTRKELSFSAISNFFKKWTVTVVDSDDSIIIDQERIIDLIDVNYFQKFELDNDKYSTSKDLSRELTVYLNLGSWYVLDVNYSNFIDESFDRINEHRKEEVFRLYETYDLNRIYDNETEYNDSFKKNKKPVNNVINADQVYLSYIEICDLIVFDNNETYLICNKKKPSGIGSRDLLNQIYSAVKVIRNQPERLSGYYNSLIRHGRMDESFIEEEIFIDKISNATFISSYILEELTNESKSMYAKLLSVETCKSLSRHGFDLIITSPHSRFIDYT